MEEFHIQWHITDRCNLRCLHCYGESFSPDSELSWPRLREICDNIIDTMRRQNRKLTLSITGGEPFMKKELWDILDYLSDEKFVSSISIITNGTIMEDYIPRLKKFPVIKDIFVSLDGLTPAVNDNIRGRGVYKKVLSNIELLKKENYRVFLMFTLLRQNLEDTKNMVSFLEENGLDGIIAERFLPLGQSQKSAEDIMISAQQLKQVYKSVFQQCGVSFSEDSVQYHALKIEDKEGEIDLMGAECIVAKDGCAILPGGDVLPCRRFNLPIGNLLSGSLDDIWHKSDVLAKLRQRSYLQGRCRNCIIEECRGCRALAFAVTGDYLAEDPLCWITCKSNLTLSL